MLWEVEKRESSLDRTSKPHQRSATQIIPRSTVRTIVDTKSISEHSITRRTMVRKSTRLSESAPSGSGHKRVASATATPAAETKRSKKATPTKSEYFAPTAQDEEIQDDDPDLPESPSENGEKLESDFDASDENAEDSDGDDGDFDEDDDEPSGRRKSGSRKGKHLSVAVRSRTKDLSLPGVKTGLGPGTQVIIKKPKARPAGKTPYTDDTIHPNTLLFLQDLKANNNRQWLKSKSLHRYLRMLEARLVVFG